MAERLSVKDMLAASRKGGAAKAAGEPAAVETEIAAEAPAVEAVEVEAAPAAAIAARPPAAPLDRPLTMKEKLAAARSGSAPAPVAVAAKVAAPSVEVVAAAPSSSAPAPTAVPLDRPLTMKEKLAAARGNAAPAAAAAAPGAKPVAAKSAAPVVAATGAARVLPPLDKITDPRDLAEALRRAGAEKDKIVKADAAAKAASAAGATPANAAAAAKASAAKKLETKTIPPKPSKDGAAAPLGRSAAASASIGRRPFLGMGIGAIIVAGWAAFTVGITGQVLGCVRFMFPNVLAEPPSTIVVGLASDFLPEQVNDRWKAEWGFWMVRSAAYDGEDKIYAIQSVCTHLGCPPNWLVAETKFKCPCHGSGFYISGVNFEGPAPRPLERFKVAVNDSGQIIVDKGQKFQEELKQWSDSDSFIVA